MNYIYVTDENTRDVLLSKNFRLLQSYEQGQKVWVFYNDPDLYDICKDAELKTKCFISDRLTMFCSGGEL